MSGHRILNIDFGVFAVQLWFAQVSDLSLWNMEDGGSLTVHIMSTGPKSSSPVILAITA